jgi:AraC-like DNA-binding protein
MIYKQIPPSPAFSPYIQYYQLTSMSDCNGNYDQYSSAVRPLPNGNLELFFHLGDSNCTIYSDKYKIKNTSSFFVGYHELYFDSTLCINSSVTSFTVVFKPLGFFGLFGYMESELTNNIILGDDIYRELKHILDALNEVNNNDIFGMQAVFEGLAKKKNSTSYEKYTWLSEIINYIKLNRGILSVQSICECFDISRRKLERAFHELLGISPYGYASIIRANRLLNKIADGSPLLQTALEFGYYDHAHFIKDFKRIIGCPPKAYLNCTPQELLNKSIANRIYMPKLPVTKKARS